MVVDVVHAVAVVAVALGAVAELHVGVVGVGDAADGALVEVALLLLHVPGGLFEVDGLPGGLMLHPEDQGGEVGPEEEDIVHQGGQDGGQAHRENQGQHRSGGADDLPGHEEDVQQGQPLGLDGDDEVKPHGDVRVEGGEGQEEGEVHIVHGGHGEPSQAAEEVGHEAEHNIQQDAAEVKEGKFGRSPFPLHEGPQKGVEKHGEDEPDELVGGGHKDKGHQPPDFSL